MEMSMRLSDNVIAVPMTELVGIEARKLGFAQCDNCFIWLTPGTMKSEHGAVLCAACMLETGRTAQEPKP